MIQVRQRATTGTAQIDTACIQMNKYVRGFISRVRCSQVGNRARATTRSNNTVFQPQAESVQFQKSLTTIGNRTAAMNAAFIPQLIKSIASCA